MVEIGEAFGHPAEATDPGSDRSAPGSSQPGTDRAAAGSKWWTTAVHGYDASTYGERFADIYDEWYPDDLATGPAVNGLAALAGVGPVLEMGVGTGRLAVPLAERGLEVWGLDASRAMLERLAAKPGGGRIHAVLGDMGGPLPGGPYGLVFIASNTLFNLASVAGPGPGVRTRRRRAEPGRAVRGGGVRSERSAVPGFGGRAPAPHGRSSRLERPSLRHRPPDRRRKLHRIHRGRWRPSPSVVDPVFDSVGAR